MESNKGFTLIEIMIVVAIIAVLAVIAMPRFAGLLNKSKEGSTREGLGAVRSALHIYFGDNMIYPYDELSSMTENGRYLSQLPFAKLPGTPHLDNRNISVGASTAAALTDAGGWAYINDPASAYYGTFLVNCSHTDLNGNLWNVQ